MRQQVHTVSRWVVGVCLFFTGVLGYLDNTLFDEDAFAERLSLAMDSPEVRSALSAKAVDVALDAANADSILADALPEEIRLAATPVLELTKPLVATAGAELLDVNVVKSGVETAARSVHRQTVSAILATEEQEVVINTRPVLVVTADAIIGPAGARAAVDLNLPESATSIKLGSNQNGVWTALRAVLGLTALIALLSLLAIIVFFSTAERGKRLVAARRLGRTMIKSGLAVLLAGGFLSVIFGAFLAVLLAGGSGLSLGKLSVGGSDGAGGLDLANVLLAPITGTGRRIVLNGLLIIAASYLLGSGDVAQAFRASVRARSSKDFFESVRRQLPNHLRAARLALTAGLAVILIAFPQSSLRTTLTLAALVAVAHLALTVVFTDGTRWSPLRQAIGWKRITATDGTERSALAAGRRRWVWGFCVLLAIIWPYYTRASTAFLVFLVAALFAWTYWWETQPLRLQAELVDTEAEPEEAWSTRRKVVTGAIAAAVLLLFITPGSDGAISPDRDSGIDEQTATVCNGFAELCDRPLNEVAFAATHNSMSAAALGWDLANHEGAIPAQLDGGVRALLIDVKRWEVDVNLGQLELDPEARAVAEAALLGAEPPKDGLWMCHNLCQLGATPFRDFVQDLRAFMEANPDEVVIVVIQDDVPAADIKAAIEGGGLRDYALTHDPGTAWPTLGAMIDDGTRLVFMAEANGESSGWYQGVYEGNVEETGFKYDVVEDFDCAPNRGEEGSPFLLVNHWVETGVPVPGEFDRVNSSDVLTERLDDCLAVRGRAPSIVAVNFWERGDLFDVVNEINGVSGS